MFPPPLRDTPTPTSHPAAGEGGSVREGARGAGVGDQYKPETQTKLRELRQVSLPKGERLQLSHSGRHGLLFARSLTEIWAYDLKAEKPVGTRAPKEQFTDMSLAPDESALFVADFGGDRKSGAACKPSHIHRFDLAKRAWDALSKSFPRSEPSNGS